jgi:hypothetical protein
MQKEQPMAGPLVTFDFAAQGRRRAGCAAYFSRQILSVLLGLLAACAALALEPQPKAATAPPLKACKVTATSELGLWDDVFVPNDRDFIVLRRGDELFSLAMTASSAPRKIARAQAAENTEIVAGAANGEKCWLFLNSSKAAPCALEANSGVVARFEIPGLRVPGSHAPVIQSCVLVPHVQAALVMVSGGDGATWPREGNRPIYFWMDLKYGKVVRFATGGDLDFFSADERIAVLASRAGKQAIDMRTGARINALPDRRKEPCIPFEWQNTQMVKPLYERRQGKGDADFFAGLSVNGLVLPVDLGLEGMRYLAVAKVGDGLAGFQLRHSGASAEPDTLWIVPFKSPEKTEAIASDVTDFAMLGQGNVVFVANEHAGKPAYSENRRHDEAFFHSRVDSASWNVLEGVERLPRLDKAFSDAAYVMDSFRVHLIDGFGASRLDPLVLCLCEHNRGDVRARTLPPDEKAVKSASWHRALLITGDGRRSLTPLFRQGSLPDQIWLHKSGRLLLGTYVWQESAGGRKRRVQLSECTLQIP